MAKDYNSSILLRSYCLVDEKVQISSSGNTFRPFVEFGSVQTLKVKSKTSTVISSKDEDTNHSTVGDQNVSNANYELRFGQHMYRYVISTCHTYRNAKKPKIEPLSLFVTSYFLSHKQEAARNLKSRNNFLENIISITYLLSLVILSLSDF